MGEIEGQRRREIGNRGTDKEERYGTEEWWRGERGRLRD